MSVASAEAKFNDPDTPDREIDYLGITVEKINYWHVNRFSHIESNLIDSLIIVAINQNSEILNEYSIGSIVLKINGEKSGKFYDTPNRLKKEYDIGKDTVLVVLDVGKGGQKYLGVPLDASFVSNIKPAELKKQEEIIKIKNLELIEIEKEKKLAEKKAKINQMKLDCEDLGFTKDTEGMGNCVLKLMELDRGNTVTTSYSSGSNKELLDIEREKLEALKAQTEEARRQANEAKRQADEAKKANRREGLKNAQDQIKKGSCIMTRSDYWNC